MLQTQLVEPSKTIMFGDKEIVGDGFHTNQLLSHDSIHGHQDSFANVSFSDGHVEAIDAHAIGHISQHTDEGYILWRGF